VPSSSFDRHLPTALPPSLQASFIAPEPGLHATPRFTVKNLGLGQSLTTVLICQGHKSHNPFDRQQNLQTLHSTRANSSKPLKIRKPHTAHVTSHSQHQEGILSLAAVFCGVRASVMANQIAMFAETIAAMKKAVKRKAYGMRWFLAVYSPR